MTSAVLKEGLVIRPQRWNLLECLAHIKSWSSHTFLSMRSDGQPLFIVPLNAATAPTRNRLRRLSVWEPPHNCRRFHDNLYQAQLSGCSALPEYRRQSLPHPYSPLRAPAFLRISRNRVQASNPHLNKSFGMNVVVKYKIPFRIWSKADICERPD